MLETSWLWFVISKEYVELTWPKIESRDPIFFTGTRSRSRVSGNDRLFPRGSEFGPNLEIPAGPAIQLRPGPANLKQFWHIFKDVLRLSGIYLILEVSVTSHAQIHHIVLGCLASFPLLIMFNLCASNFCKNRCTINEYFRMYRTLLG